MTTQHQQSTTGGAGDGPFRVLVVCEGNICRSPVAALLLAAALGPDVEVTSAGTRAVVGAPAEPAMTAFLGERAAGLDGFRARQLRPDQVRAADLVLTMSRRQRGATVALAPAAVKRAFTLRELARLLGDVDPEALGDPGSGTLGERLRRALPAAAAQRRFVTDPRVDDIADPYGRDEAAYARAYEAITDAVARVVGVLAPDGLATAGDGSV
ncbi:protein-tyrosine-phosphatase [Microlunatus spumicola]|uniref:Protein-tyrosine-phosphatase n=1 Tax=Microlunatus spumicola TaxID=81499 RepID=A0ABP6X804_9ACTN